MTTPQKRAKSYGYATEVAALKALRAVFPRLRRVGSPAYKKAAADLVQDGVGLPFRLVVTRDRNQPLLVTLSVEDLLSLCSVPDDGVIVYVQVKGRARTWVGSLMRELRKATR